MHTAAQCWKTCKADACFRKRCVWSPWCKQMPQTSLTFMFACIIKGVTQRQFACKIHSEPQVTNFPANLPLWASLNPASWNGSMMVHDDSVDPLPLLNTFNISSVNPTKKTKRLPSGAFGQYGIFLFPQTSRGGLCSQTPSPHTEVRQCIVKV